MYYRKGKFLRVAETIDANVVAVEAEDLGLSVWRHWAGDGNSHAQSENDELWKKYNFNKLPFVMLISSISWNFSGISPLKIKSR